MATNLSSVQSQEVTLHPEAVARVSGILQTFPDVSTLTQLSAAMTAYALELDKAITKKPGRQDAARLREVSDLLIIQAVQVKAGAMGLLGDQAGKAIADLKEVTVEASDALAQITMIRKALRIGVALLGVVAAFTAGVPGPAVAALVKLKDSIAAT